MVSDFEAILGRIDVAVLVLNPSGRVIYANVAATRLLGCERDALFALASVEQSWGCMDESGQRLSSEELPSRVARHTRQPVRMTLQLQRADERIWIELQVEPSSTPAGELEHLVFSLRDVSRERESRLEAQRARETNEQLYRSVLRAMSEGVVVHGPDGSIEFANPAAERVLGLSLDQMMGRAAVDPRWQLVDTDERPLDPRKIPSEVTRATGQPCDQFVLGVHRPDGELAWLSVSTDAVAAETTTARPRGVVATFTDITQSVLIKRELERSRERFKLVTDAFPGLLYEFRGRSGRYYFTFLSGRAREFFGPRVEEMMQDAVPLMENLHPEEREAFLSSIQESERSLTPWQLEMRLPFVDGTGWRWVRAQSVPTREGDEVVWHGVLLDVTEQRRMADVLRHRQKVEAMGELVAGVAHNFNNMLAVIIPNIELALEVESAETQLLLREARHAAQNAAELVRQLMRITRREPGAAPELVNMVGVVREVGALLSRTLGSTLRLRIEAPEEPLYTRGVNSDLNMVLLNLCFNARDALKGNPDAELAVRLSRQQQELLLEVRDNGVGMSAGMLGRLGEPFFTTKQPGAGTGLGVATVYGIVRSLGGRVEVDSQVGVGTCFRVYLPFATRSTPSSPAESILPRRLHDVRALVIEDEALVREAVKRQLESVGATVETASDGEAGLSAIVQRRFDVVLLDLNMPGLPGTRILERIREIAPEQVVIVLTGHVGPSSELSAASAVLTKPASRSALVEAISRARAPRAPGS